MQVITTLIGYGNGVLEAHHRLPHPLDVRPTKNSVLAQRLQVAQADRDEAIGKSTGERRWLPSGAPLRSVR